ncbi:phosphoribosyl-AMP cyclohydrolase [Alterisphingorhabdus coralli]|uniref:Phosphoribosyl-AMP cyclohydrolase n=1 Tax=Alterisphingorhabdus coralli TaxID=3071408 RepID=A0AA97F6D0_9SPHN|nr:phosphoribosyl-AMP cyclohydrolase [Parasphingorhabdus sp. SCSIO 66989]WOE75224.1 phosphoribosyl-AMP cyclohydrolase [Parasphingorhabdus sp. SCSIO 66989]
MTNLRDTARISLVAIAAMGLAACQPGAEQGAETAEGAKSCITEEEVVNAQKAWGDGIVAIGKTFTEEGDYTTAATDHINKFYGYDLDGVVLFKPTLAADEQFRGSFDGALSYFVGGNETFKEDKGFALTPWTAVRWENAGITNSSCDMAVAMGNYWFTPAEGDEIKVEYTIGYVKDDEGNLRMVVHKSSLPYAGS